MTSTPLSPVAARYLGQSVTRKEDRRLLTGHGLYVDDVDGARACCTPRSSAATSQGHHHADRHECGQGAAGVVAVYTWEDFNGITARAGTPCSARSSWCRHRSRSPTSGTSATRSPWSSPRAATWPRTRASSIEVDYDVAAAGCRLHDRRRRHRARGARRLGPRVERDGGGAVHAAVRRPRRGRSPAPRTWWSATSSRTATSPCPWRPGASWRRTAPGRDELDIVCATQSVHETRNFFSRYLQIPEGNVRVDGSRRRRRLRPEDVRVPRGVRGGAGLVRLLGRPVKWIEDRRENLIAAGHSRNEYGHVRMAIDADGIIQAITAEHKADVGAYAGVPGGDGPDARCPGRTRSHATASRWRWCWTNTMGKAAYRGPWMFETTAREMAIDYAASEIGIDPVEFRRRNLLAASDLPFTAPTGQRVQGDHTARDARAGTRDPRLRGLPHGAGRGARRGPLPRRGHQRATSSRRRWAAPPCHRGGHGPGRRPAAGSWPISAPRRTARASRPPWPRSSPTPRGVDYDDVTIVQADTQSTPYGPRHRREPHRGRRRRRGAGRRRVAVREKVLRDRRAHDGGVARRPRDRRERRSRCGARRRSR